MKQIFYKLGSNVASYALYLCLFTIGLTLVGCAILAARKMHEKFKVAMLLPGSISDAGWNALAYEGLQAIEKQLGAETSHAETRTPDRSGRTIPCLCGLDGYHMVFGHGYEFQDPAKAVATDFLRRFSLPLPVVPSPTTSHLSTFVLNRQRIC